MTMEDDEGPDPGANVEGGEDAIDRDDAASGASDSPHWCRGLNGKSRLVPQCLADTSFPA